MPAPISTSVSKARRRAARPALSMSPAASATGPPGLCLCFPKPGSVNGRLVLAPGDVNLTFKRYIESPVQLHDRERLCHAHRRRWSRCRTDALLLRGVERPRGLCDLACRLGHESDRALGRDDHVRQPQITAPSCAPLPAISSSRPARTKPPAGSPPAISISRCATARSSSTARSWWIVVCCARSCGRMG